MPAGGQRAGLGFTVADHAADQQFRVIEGGAVGVQQGISQFAAFIDGARRIRRGMAGNAIGPGKLHEQALHAGGILGDPGIQLRVCALKIGVGHHSGTAVPRAGNVDGVQPVFEDHPVHVRVNKIQAGSGAEMTQQARLGMLQAQRLAQERIVAQVNLAHGKIIGGTPVGIHSL